MPGFPAGVFYLLTSVNQLREHENAEGHSNTDERMPSVVKVPSWSHTTTAALGGQFNFAARVP